jgi:hypothetical protein
MAKLTAKTRSAIPTKSFALPGRRYPIENKAHAANALARVSQFGTPEEKSKVRSAVARKYPKMGGHAVKKREPKRHPAHYRTHSGSRARARG